MTTTPTLWLDADQVNTTDEPEEGANAGATNVQSHSTVVALTGGRYLVAWEDGSSKFAFGLEPRDIVGQIYDALGNRIGGEIGLSVLYQDLDQKLQDIVALPDGGFAVVYQTSDAAGAGDLENITVEIFDSTGSWSRTDDFRQGFGGPPDIDDVSPAIASFDDGSYVVTFANDAAAAGSYDIDAYVVAADGTKGAAIAIEATAGNARTPDVAVLANQNFVVVYELGGDLKYTIRTSAGGTVGSGDIAATASNETVPVVSAFKTGGFVVAWADSAGDGAGNAGIKARVFTDGGTGGTVIQVNTLTTGVQEDPAVTVLADGSFVVAWRDAVTDTIEGARFSAGGTPIGAQFTIADVDDCSEPALALLSDGRFVATFTSTAAGNPNVFGAIWDPRTSPIVGTADADILTSRRDGALVQGGAGGDRIYGFAGNDRLDGGTQTDTMQGGLGNDSYIVDVPTDQAVEITGQGNDTVFAAVSYTLAAGQSIEDLRTTNTSGTGAINLTGNEAAQYLYGNAGQNALNGLGGADTMTGFRGNDAYAVDNVGDRVVEAIGQGNDTVLASISYALEAGQSVEDLRTSSTSGTTALNLTGNGVAQSLYGNAGSNVLNGLGGADTMTGFKGNDAYVVDSDADVVIEAANQGSDTVLASVNYALGAGQSIEDLRTTNTSGTAALILRGNELAQAIYGNAGNNELNGMGGADTMAGFRGDDGYIVDHVGDRVSEAVNQGTDIVLSSVSYTLAAGQSIEQLRTDNDNGLAALKLTGNEFAQNLLGNDGANTLNGMGGADTMRGFKGNDAYIVDDAGDVIVETVGAGQGSDIAYAYTSYTLGIGTSVEVLRTDSDTGTTAINLTGNEQANMLIGNAGANILDGGDGKDSLTPGNDSAVDTIRFSAVSHSTSVNRDTVTGMDFNEDKLDFTIVPNAFAVVTVGALNEGATFDANLATAVNAALAVNGAVLLDPNGGTLNIAGHYYLVVDGNGDGSYTAGSDYVLQIVNPTGTLDLTDFV